MYEQYEGLTLKEIAPDLDCNYKGVVIFQLRDVNDVQGRRIAEDFSLKTLLFRLPNLSDKKVVSANDFFGQTIFRVL